METYVELEAFSNYYIDLLEPAFEELENIPGVLAINIAVEDDTYYSMLFKIEENYSIIGAMKLAYDVLCDSDFVILSQNIK